MARDRADAAGVERSRERIVSPGEAVEGLRPGATIGIGGILNAAHPMTIVRELIRRRVGDLHLVSMAGGLEIDLLIAAGLVAKVTSPSVSGESLNPAAGFAFRRAAERGEIAVNEIDEGLVQVALQAAAQRVPFATWLGGLGTSLPALNELLFEFPSPLDGRNALGVRPLHLDLACIHAATADAFGNVQPTGSGYGDKALARAARRVVATVEEIVPNEVVRANPSRTMIPGADLLVHAPFGSHPFAAPGGYIADAAHLKGYLAATERWYREDDRGALDDYLREWVTGPADHWAYLDRVGPARLYGLAEGLHP
jgi:glutaconate CoA-transferase, subunit A